MSCESRGEKEGGREMGKGGNSEDAVSGKEHGEENMAAWLLGIKTLKIQPYILPSLGIIPFPPFMFSFFQVSFHNFPLFFCCFRPL